MHSFFVFLLSLGSLWHLKPNSHFDAKQILKRFWYSFLKNQNLRTSVRSNRIIIHPRRKFRKRAINLRSKKCFSSILTSQDMVCDFEAKLRSFVIHKTKWCGVTNTQMTEDNPHLTSSTAKVTNVEYVANRLRFKVGITCLQKWSDLHSISSLESYRCDKMQRNFNLKR